MNSAILTLLLALVPASSFASGFSCQAKEDAVSAALVNSPKWGWIATLTDNYDTTQRPKPTADGLYWMSCKEDGSQIRCGGEWNFSSFTPPLHQEIEAVFERDLNGITSVTFPRSPIWGLPLITLSCAADPHL